MPAPKGNQYACDHGQGAPKQYTQEWLEQEAIEFKQWMQREDSVFFKSFAVERGYHPNRLAEFAEGSEVFAGVYHLAKIWQEIRLVNYGLFNRTNCGMTKFVLANHHGYSERSQVSGDTVNPLALLLGKLDGTTKELLNDEGS
jgi:hypothetical protein